MKMFHRLFIGGLLLSCLFFGFYHYDAKAEDAAKPVPPMVIAPPAGGLPVVDVTAKITDTVEKVNKFTFDTLWSALKKTLTRTYSSLLKKYVNELANETALYAANGFKGQTPAYFTQGWKEFGIDLASNAAGTFVENYFTALEEGSSSTAVKQRDIDCGGKIIHIKGTSATTNSEWFDANDETSLDITIQIDNGDIYDDLFVALDAINSIVDSPEVMDCKSAVMGAYQLIEKGEGASVGGTTNRVKFKEYLGSDFDICQPSSLMVGFKIGLGLNGASTGAGDNLCDFRDTFYGFNKTENGNWANATSSWARAIQKSINDQENYLKGVQTIFDPRANDLGIGFALQSQQDTIIATSTELGKIERLANNEAKRKTNAGGRYIELPGTLDIKLGDADARKRETFFTQTGDILLDSANLFISVLTNKMYDKYMAKLLELVAGQDGGSKGSAKLNDFYSSNSFGMAESEALLAPITDMNFSAGSDLDLLSNLGSCPDAANPGPMNCVVNNNFIQAVTQEITVGEALKKGLLNSNGRFGSAKPDDTLNIDSGDITWRSMKILRKYRILPVSWEVAAEKLAELDITERQVTVGDMIGCYNQLDQYDTGYNQDWCRGMIDPNWPLRAPLSYCLKSGFGNQVDYLDILTNDQAATGTVPASLGTVNLLRRGNYCADEQSCLKEGENNSCDIYGYCTEDRRIWKFPSNTCQPYFNTCQAYTDTLGQKTAYLANTLDYGNCNADNSGCAAYCSQYNWASSSYSCTPGNETDKYYLSAKAESCSENQDGCQQLIRLTNNGNVNLLFNGDFEFSQGGATSSNNRLDNWLIGNSAIIVTSSDQVYSGQNSLKIINSSAYSGLISYDWSEPNQSSLPKDFLMRPGISYTFSAYVYSEEVPVTIGIGNGDPALNNDSWLTKTTTTTNEWEKISITINNDEYYNTNAIAIYSEDIGDFYVDNLMLEISSQGNQGYRPYRQVGYTYEKILPEYLRSACYIQSGDSLIERPDAPAECDNYARTCLAAEADCQMFTNSYTGDMIPAKTNLQNYCPASCVGFASFWQEATIFNDGEEKPLIPNSATACSEASVGCSEFTNLDNLEAGGENKEYFSYLRQCVKPDEPQANCAEFYNWQNTANTGLQLYSYTWQAEANGSPKLTDQRQECSASSIQPSSLDYNPDCREVRNQAGTVFYVPYSKTISCNANCLTYRLSKNNVVENLTTSASCQGAGGNWLAAKAECFICRGNGQWNENNQACLYRGLPTESQTCGADQNTCKHYSGTGAANWRLILNHNFNDGPDDWSGAATSSETLRTDGYSLLTNDNRTQVALDNGDLRNGAKYRLQFFAKALASTVSLNEIGLRNDAAVIANFNLPTTGINLKSNDWQFYSLDISTAISQVDDEVEQKLYLEANGRFFLDEVRLMEVRDEYYLLENSLQIPAACNQDYNGSPATGFMLGCQEYQDNNNNTHYLHGFSDLCQESAVGCEAMINTHNQTNYYYPFQPANSSDEVETTAVDEIIYAIYDQDKLCASSDKGCQRLGKEIVYQDQAVYDSVYLKLDPDRYRSEATNPIKCSADVVGCQTFVGDTNGLNFFKDPGSQLCEWRANEDGTSFSWYKRPVKSCSQTANFKFCASNGDCSSISSTSQCMANQELISCPVNNNVGKTIGVGGDIVRQPKIDTQGQNWAGLCPATQSGCTEYLDPLSRVNSDILITKPTSSAFYQSVPLQAFTSYVLQVKANPAITNDGVSWRLANTDFWLMNEQNKFIATSSEQLLLIDQYSENPSNSQNNNYYNSAIFMTNGATNLIITIPTSSVTKIKDISVRPTVVSYQLNQNLNNSECTDGKTNYDQGCLLFNERNYQQDNYSALLYNTNLSANDANGVSPKSLEGNNNANRLIKVQPSRTCGKWLECTTYNSVQDNDGNVNKVCTDFGLCDSFDAYNNCAHFIEMSTTTVNQTVGVNLTLDQIRNLTGYSKVGYASSANNNYYNNYYHLAVMSETGKNIEQSINGSFELAPGSLEQNGDQLLYNYSASGWSNPSNLATVIVSPQQAINLDSSFSNNYLAPDGKNFLRLATKLQGNDGFYGYTKTDAANLIKVEGKTAYNMVGTVRTINNSRAGFKIWEYTCKNPSTSTPCRPQVIAGNPNNITNSLTIADTDGKWQNKVLSFTTKTDTKYIQLELDAYTENGIAYFDNIQVKPSLAYRSSGANDQLIAPSCRLYPEGNSLSCDYKSSSNNVVRKKGLMGYCLEYDPANEKNCLLWYPLDKIAADLVEEGVGYNGKRPLYYCLEATSSLRLEYRHAFQLNETSECEGCNAVGSCTGSTGGDYLVWKTLGDSGSHDDNEEDQRKICKPNCDNRLIAVNHINDLRNAERCEDSCRLDTDLEHSCDGWYPYDGQILDYTSFDGSDNNINPIGYKLSKKNIDGIDSSTSSQARMFCLYYNGSWDDANDQCSKDGQTVYVKGEIYRDQFALNVTSNNNDVPLSAPVFCTKFVKIVDDSGSNAYWADRIKEGSSFIMPCYIPSYIPNATSTTFDQTNCFFDQTSVPFASIGYPVNQGSEPEGWDSLLNSTTPKQQPLFYQDLASGVHLGRIYSANINSTAHPRYLFAQSYGGFEWQFEEGKGVNGHDYFADSGHYVANSSAAWTSWSPPTNYCAGNIRTSTNTPSSYCLVKPSIENVRVNDTPIVSGGTITSTLPVFNVNLTFNSKINPSQRPLKRVQIDWGDNSAAYDRSGNFLDRADATAPHQFTHRYTCQVAAGGGCQTNNIIVTLTDNWGATSSFPLNIQPGQGAN